MGRKKVLVLLVLAGLMLHGSAAGAAIPRIGADAAVLIDAKTGELLYAKNAHKRRAPASTTKVMTAILALEMGNLTDRVTVSSTAANVKVGTDAGLRAGDVLTLEDLLKASLIASANDAAVALAEYAGGSVDLFAEMMTRKARLLGARNTSFVNPNGYSENGHYSTAYDLALITRYALANEKFASMVSTSKDNIDWLNREQSMELQNTNRLLGTYEGADGVKTGTTDAAGQCLVASATRYDHRLIAVVLRSGYRFGEAAGLLDHGFRDYYHWRLGAGDLFTVVPVRHGATGIVDVVAGNSVESTIPLAEIQTVDLRVTLDQHPRAPVQQGQVLGEAVLYVRGSEVGRTALMAGQTVRRRYWWQR